MRDRPCRSRPYACTTTSLVSLSKCHVRHRETWHGITGVSFVYAAPRCRRFAADISLAAAAAAAAALSQHRSNRTRARDPFPFLNRGNSICARVAPLLNFMNLSAVFFRIDIRARYKGRIYLIKIISSRIGIFPSRFGLNYGTGSERNTAGLSHLFPTLRFRNIYESVIYAGNNLPIFFSIRDTRAEKFLETRDERPKLILFGLFVDGIRT